MKEQYDFVVIGGGSAGYAAAGVATNLGLDTAIIEGGEEVGGLCILRGCMPSKTFIESANRAVTIRRAQDFGLRAGDFSVKGGEILERKKALVAEFQAHRRQQLENGKFDFIRGTASFTGPNTVEVKLIEGGATATVSAKSFLIATGSCTHGVEIPGLRETGFLDSDSVLESPEIPGSIIVLGGGATALEFGHYYNSLGSQVTMIQRSAQILKEMDVDISTALADVVRRRGIRLLCETTLVRVERVEGRKRVVFVQEGREQSVEADQIMYGLGRSPVLNALGLDKAGVRVKNDHLALDPSLRTTATHIFAAGDVAGPHEIVHIAVQQGEVAARNAARVIRGSPEPLEEVDYRLNMFAIFSMPEAASAGMTEKELTARGIPYLKACYPFVEVGKAMVMGEIEGFVKLVVHRDTREILGAAAVGVKVSELIHEIVVAMYFHATAGDLAQIPHYHPTLSEIWTYPAEELAAKK